MTIPAVYCFVLLLIVYGTAALPMKGTCRFRARQRVECGWSGISGSECRSRGCCWDDSIKTSIFCYKSDERKSDQGKVGRIARFEEPFAPVSLINGGERSVMNTCSVTLQDRVQCGWPSISRRTCEIRGCCFERSPRVGPWCYQSDSLLIGSRMRTMLQCAWECSKISWKKIAMAYARCGTIASCWMMIAGQSSGTCLAACKAEQNFDVYMSNITSCLQLGERESKLTRRRCKGDLPCWVDAFGEEALRCFEKFQEHGKYSSVEIPDEDITSEKISPEEVVSPEERPEIPYEEEIENEEIPHEENPGVPVQHENRFSILTDKDVERSAHLNVETQLLD